MNATATDTDRALALGCRLSRRLVAVCGQGASSGEPELAVVLGPLAGMFGWHAELLFDVLPVRAGIDRDTLVNVDAGTDAAMDLLDELVSGNDSVALRTSLALVVDWLAAFIARERHTSEPLLEGPRARALALIARDLDDASTALDAVAARVAHHSAPSVNSLEAVVRVGAALGAVSPDAGVTSRTVLQEGLTAPVE